MTTSFWKTAAASLPPAVQRRYAAEFAAAERLEQVLELILAAGSLARPALAKSCQTVALALRATARFLEAAAKRLSLTH
jgi:hypothetical protein